MSDDEDKGRALIKSGTGVSKPWIRKEVEDIKKILDELPDCIDKEQLRRALGYCQARIEAMQNLVGR